jgi:uncharacterized repeat protein (TIGR03806 family)
MSFPHRSRAFRVVVLGCVGAVLPGCRADGTPPARPGGAGSGAPMGAAGQGGSSATGGTGPAGAGGAGGAAGTAGGAAGVAGVAGAAGAGADARARVDGSPADAATPVLPKIAVLTQRYGNARLGWNDKEALLGPDVVGSPRFGKLFSRPVKGQIYAQPLVVPDVDLGSRGRHDVVFVATQANRVYAFDASDPAQSAPLWVTDLGASVPFVPMAAPDFVNRGFCGCLDIFPELGITATPVIERTTGTLYVVSKHLGPGDVFFLQLSALDLRTGSQKPGSPVKITASAPGGGDGSVDGKVAFDGRRHNVRAALLLLAGRLYLAFTSHGDTPPYRGWLMAYDAATLRQISAWLTVNNGGGGAIWMSGSGPSADEQGNIYVSTGNGTVTTAGPALDLSHAVIKLATNGGVLRLLDWFVVGAWEAFNAVDVDFGSSAVLVLPRSNTVLTAGKSGPAYLLDRNNLGKFRPDDSHALQKVQLPPPTTMYQHHAGFAYWEGPLGPMVFDWPSVGPQSQPGKLIGIKLTGGRLESTPALVGPHAVMGKPGASVSISSNGARAGVVWTYAAEATSLDNTPQTSALPAILRAYDASDLRPLWDSSRNRTRDAPGNHAKFVIPTVANGRLYLPTFSDQLVVYGQLPGGDTPLGAGGGPAPPPAGSGRCEPPADPRSPPARLSQTGCVDPGDPTRPAAGLLPYDVNSPLWSDGTSKERFIALPAGKQVHVKDCRRDPATCQPTAAGGSPHDPGHFEVPVGTVLVKSFLIAGKRIETRLLVHFADTWRGYSYQWNDQQTEATLIAEEEGAVERVFSNPALPGGQQTWTYPSRQDCLTCHLGAAGFQLGLELVQLNRELTYPDGTRGNQLDVWERRGLFDQPLARPFPAPLPAPMGGQGTVEQRARSYLHANCAICHRPDSNFPSLDLRHFTPLQAAGACNVRPIKGEVGVPGALLIAPGSPERSVLSLRMRLLDVGRMPQIATRYLDGQGVAVVESWIRALPGCP